MSRGAILRAAAQSITYLSFSSCRHLIATIHTWHRRSPRSALYACSTGWFEQRRHTAKDAMKAKAQKLAFTAPATKLPGYYGRGPQVGWFAQWAREQSKQKHGPAHRNARAGPWRAHLDPRRRFQAHPGGGRSAARPRGLTLRSPEKPRATPSS
jgi:hypothetical protein